jgi:hypothetical protein
VLLRGVPIRQDRAKPAAIDRANFYGDACSHPMDSHRIKPLGIPDGTQASDLDH